MNFSQLNVPNFLKHLRNEIKRRRFFLLFWDKPYQETNFKSNLNSAPSCKLGKNTVRFAHVLLFHFISLFFLSGFSFTDTDDSQDSRGREGTIFCSTVPLPTAHEHSDIYFTTLHMRWLSHIFNGTACIYQAATRWDLPP